MNLHRTECGLELGNNLPPSPEYNRTIRQSISINEMHNALNRERIRNLRINSLTDIVICICAIGIFGFVAYFVLEQKYIKI